MYLEIFEMKKFKSIFLLLALGWFTGINALGQEAEESKETIVAEADSLVLPEGMQIQEIDSLLRDWSVRNFLTFDENCETTGGNPTFEPEVYISRLQRLPNVIEMPYNDVVRR